MRDDKRRLTERTIQRQFSALHQFFKFAVNNEELTEMQRINLLGTFSFEMDKGAREQREEWPIDDLVTLFRSPLYVGSQQHRRWKRGPLIIRDAKFWLPLLALFHGGRVEEFADLYRRDIQRDKDGTPFMYIRKWEEDGERRRLKTHAAKRRLPVHPELLRMGFLEHVEQAASNNNQPVFPDLPRQAPDGKRGPGFTRWFGRYRKAIGIFREGVAAHSFRHNAETRLNAAKADTRHVDYLMGHQPTGGEGRRRYDKGPPPSESVTTLSLLSYPELDFSHLHIHSSA